MKKVFLTLMVCAGLAACTSDDVVIGTTSDSAFNGGDLYMQVFISDVKDGGTRATGTDIDGYNTYSNGSKDEYAVNDAKFYFYDKDGVFISRASVWADGAATTTDGTSVEYTSGTMIVLKGLTSTQLPKYMVTILNEPSDFEDAGTYDPANTLGELEQKLVDGITTTSGTSSNTDYFIMSTSSYTDTTYDGSGATTATRSADNKHYFVTEISESNFLEEPVTSGYDDSAVQVYVERLAAKVEVKVDGLTGTTTTDGDTYYELDITVGGTANDYNEYEQEQGQGQGTSSTVIDGVDQVYVKFLGWKLNATARQSYIMKNVDDAWNSSGYWTSSTWNVDTKAWNDSTRYRSYWGKGTAYGTGSFPTTNINSTTGESNTDSDEATASTGLNDYLQYTSLKRDLINISTGSTGTTEETNIYGYCAENTNVIATNENATNGIKDEYSSGITSVLLKAQAYSYDSQTGYSPLALVNYGGFYWTVDGFKDEVAREEVNYDIKNVETLATEAGVGEALAVVLKQLVGYMDPELYCATNKIGDSWGDDDYIKTFDGSFLGLVDLGNGGVGIWPKDSGETHSGDQSAEISSKYSPVYDTTDPETEKYPATDDLDNYYLYLKITDYSSWSSSISGTLLSSSAVKDADGNYYFYLDEENTLGNYTYRQFFVKALEMEAEETNEYFAGIIDADGSSVTTTSSTAAPNLYYDGQMYYSIPIEHLVSATESTQGGEGTIVEGQYGVVRNHWYTISITGLSKLGKGISNESAVIVPDPEGVDTWLLPAQVNINAWMKVGDQKVSL